MHLFASRAIPLLHDATIKNFFITVRRTQFGNDSSQQDFWKCLGSSRLILDQSLSGNERARKRSSGILKTCAAIRVMKRNWSVNYGGLKVSLERAKGDREILFNADNSRVYARRYTSKLNVMGP